jgi:hypothetical protein
MKSSDILQLLTNFPKESTLSDVLEILKEQELQKEALYNANEKLFLESFKGKFYSYENDDDLELFNIIEIIPASVFTDVINGRERYYNLTALCIKLSFDRISVRDISKTSTWTHDVYSKSKLESFKEIDSIKWYQFLDLYNAQEQTLHSFKKLFEQL